MGTLREAYGELREKVLALRDGGRDVGPLPPREPEFVLVIQNLLDG